MKHVKKSVLLWYAPHEIYALVTDVASYPQFLPWCERAEVLSRDEQGLTARLHLAYGGLRHAFTTRNVHELDRSVHVGLVDGPFSVLDGLWRFTPLQLPDGSAAGGTPAAACKIEFELRYGFANVVLEAAISPVFDRIADTLVDSFVRRAEQVHGQR